MLRLLSAAAFAAFLAAPAIAQATFDRDIGTRVGTGADDEIVSGIALGHAFAFPDGTVTNTIDLDSNGRILLPSASNLSDFSPTINEFVDGESSICPLWQDLTPMPASPPAAPQASPVSGLYVKTNAFRTTITWVDVKKCCVSFPELFTLQCQLFPSGDIAFVYDNRVISDIRVSSSSIFPALVGVSVGTPGGVGGGSDPGESDLSSGISTTLKTVYEYFDTSASMCDVRGLGMRFTPNMTGGYDVTVGPAGVTAGGAERHGRPSPVSIQFFPDGAGGYFVQRATPSFFDDGGLGTELAAPPVGLGDDLFAPPQPLGFTFTWPGGLTTTDVVVDNNGRVMSDGRAPTSTGWRPGLAEFTNYGATIAGFWTDLSSQRGSLRIFTGGTAPTRFAAITWEDVPKFAETLPNTFQIVLNEDGSFSLNYVDTLGWQTNAGLTSDDVLVGCSPGNGAVAPAAIDFSDITNVTGQPVIYEFWDSSRTNGPNSNEPQMPEIQTILTARSSPNVGGAFELRLIGLSTATVSTSIMVGFSNPNIDLGIFPFFLTGNTLLVDPIVTLGVAPNASDPTTADFQLGITNDPTQAGLPVIFQGISISPTESPNPSLPLVLTNSVQAAVQI